MPYYEKLLNKFDKFLYEDVDSFLSQVKRIKAKQGQKQRQKNQNLIKKE